MKKAEHMRVLVAFGALSQVGGEAFEDSGANALRFCQEAIRGRSMPMFE